jgi:hypothetical protein
MPSFINAVVTGGETMLCKIPLGSPTTKKRKQIFLQPGFMQTESLCQKF